MDGIIDVKANDLIGPHKIGDNIRVRKPQKFTPFAIQTVRSLTQTVEYILISYNQDTCTYKARADNNIENKEQS